jgi:hypothetical protein
MTDNQEQLNQHWQELAEQLGLEPVESSAPPPQPTSKEEKAEAPQPARPERVEPAVTKTEDAVSFAPHEEAISPVEVEAIPAQATDQFVSAAEASGDEEPRRVEPAAVQESSAERGGRRARRPERGDRDRTSPRRRDSSRRREQETVAARAGDWPAESPETAPEDEFSDELETESVEETPPAEDRKEDDDADDLDTLSDWNVPSWAELIASLYRPER